MSILTITAPEGDLAGYAEFVASELHNGMTSGHFDSQRHWTTAAEETTPAKFVQLVVTVPIDRVDLDLSVGIAKRAMQDAAYTFWALSKYQGTEDLVETGAAEIGQPIHGDNGRIVASFRIMGVTA